MQTVKTIGAILLGIVVFAFVYGNIGVNAAILLALAVGAIMLLRKKPARDHSSMLARDTTLDDTDSGSDDTSASRATARHQALLDMDQHTYVIMANGRREQERRKRLEAQSEVLDLTAKNRELEAEIVRLKKQVRDLDDLLGDPFADPPEHAQKVG